MGSFSMLHKPFSNGLQIHIRLINSFFFPSGTKWLRRLSPTSRIGCSRVKETIIEEEEKIPFYISTPKLLSILYKTVYIIPQDTLYYADANLFLRKSCSMTYCYKKEKGNTLKPGSSCSRENYV